MFKLKTQNLKLKTLFFAFALLTAALPAWAATSQIAEGGRQAAAVMSDGMLEGGVMG